MCEQTASSKEHVFPAAFGGRRVNKGIYCGVHNNALGVHVGSLLDTLGFFNSYLGVRSDHHDAPKPYVLDGSSGERYQILRDNIEIAPPPSMTQTPELIGKPVTLQFSSDKQRQKWMAEQRRLGFEFQFSEVGTAQTQFFTQPIKQSFHFGSNEFRSAIAYVALTYLAHYFPELARQASLEELKSILLDGGEIGDRVWWLDPKALPLVKEPAFNKFHTVVVGTSAENGAASAVISFFGQLCLAVDLGRLDGLKTERVIVHINPLAERAGQDQDVSVYRDEGVELDIGSVDDSKEYLRAVVAGEVQNPVSNIISDLQDDHLDALVSEHMPSLLEALTLSDEARLDVVRSFVDLQGQRVLNIMRAGIRDFLEAAQDFPPQLRTEVAKVLEDDPEGPLGLTQFAIDALEVAKTGVAHEIVRQLEAGSLTEEELILLVAGGPGAAAAIRPVIHAAIAKLEE